MSKEKEEAINSQVMSIAGRPKGFSCIKCTKVSDCCYRVNIYITNDHGAINHSEIISSYFITVNDDNQIIKADPEIRRLN